MSDFGGSIWSAAILLFLLMDPLGNIPVILSVLKGIDPKRQRFIIARELLMALVILLGFLYGGKPLLRFLHLQQEAVTISGALILLIIGLRMIFPKPEGIIGSGPGGEPFLVPIAVPMIAGPSVMAMLILMVENKPGQMTNWFMALLIAWGMSAVILLSAPILLKIFRERGLIAIERLMGMLLVMISVQMFIDGFKVIFG